MTLALDLVGRMLLGLNFFFFGLNGFFHWKSLPEATPAMQRFVGALIETGYMMTVVKGLEILIGFCLLTDQFVLLALTAATPLVFGIVSSQLILNRGRGWGISALTVVPFGILIFTRWDQLQLLWVR